MKKLTLLLAVMMMCGTLTYAQKFGVINTQELVASMPEQDSALVKFQAFQQELSDQMETIQVEFNTKYMDYQKGVETMTEAVRKLKEKELQDLETRYQEFQQSAQQDVQNMQQLLMSPIFTKAQEAIQTVANANSFTMVFDITSGSVAYQDASTVVNLLPLVQAHLGITPTAAE